MGRGDGSTVTGKVVLYLAGVAYALLAGCVLTRIIGFDDPEV
ncbi:hypothetical protein EDC52_11335 [Biostraticola tofi]|uniref:Lipoprotein n=1 Tax=Biostraticola tofi TaxID=466109 RepID=A0A4R3YJA1_9GAMM|nr:hypothetical protein EDC52_11335 [Biostraticola tofi]